jgi:hypothetical protein
MAALHYMGTWEETPYVPGTRQLGAMWVHDIKYNDKGGVYKFKARLVARGDRQIPGTDFGDTFAATAQMRTVRLLVVLGLIFKADLTHCDISNAFTNGELEEELYMRSPPGYPGAQGMMLRLLKSLYGLRQASRIWQETLTAALLDIGFRQCEADTCLFYHPTKLCFISIHVDDLLILCDDPDVRQYVVTELSNAFKMSDLGTVSVYLGMNFSFPKPGLATITQTTYIDKMVQRFNMADAKPARTPLPASTLLTKDDSPTSVEETAIMAGIPYRALVGSLLYAARGTRPEISFPVSALSRFNTAPGTAHWKHAKHVLKYLKSTPTHGLYYTDSGTQEINVEIQSDSDWGSNVDDRRSTTGYVLLVNGNPVSWCSRKQKSTALSSCEAEFMALSEAMREGLWLRQLLIELDVGYVGPVIIRVDNQSAIKLAENPVQHQRSKHIDIRYFRIREEIRDGTIKVLYVPTEDNVADLLTKNTALAQFLRNIGALVQETDVT